MNFQIINEDVLVDTHDHNNTCTEIEVKRSKIQQQKHRCQKKLLQQPTTGITSKQISKQPSKLGCGMPSIKKT